MKMTQAMQVVVQNNIITGALTASAHAVRVPLMVRVITALPWLQTKAAGFLALGVRPEHVHSPIAQASPPGAQAAIR